MALPSNEKELTMDDPVELEVAKITDIDSVPSVIYNLYATNLMTHDIIYVTYFQHFRIYGKGAYCNICNTSVGTSRLRDHCRKAGHTDLPDSIAPSWRTLEKNAKKVECALSVIPCSPQGKWVERSKCSKCFRSFSHQNFNYHFDNNDGFLCKGAIPLRAYYVKSSAGHYYEVQQQQPWMSLAPALHPQRNLPCLPQAYWYP
jgi:hypothetical protein